MTRAHNFCAGPCTLPEEVVAELGEEMLCYGDAGMSVIEMSHRSPAYEVIHQETLQLLRSLYRVPEEFDILLIQGGATLQFAMLPLNLLGPGAKAGYLATGAWARKALDDATRIGSTYVAWDGAGRLPTTMPTPGDVVIEPDTNFLHITSNETIEGVRLPAFDGFGARLVADMSSDYLSRAIDWDLFDLVYGGAQKNLGPAGLAVVFIRKSLMVDTPDHLPTYLRYDTHAKSDSLANTPAMFTIWAMGKVLRWMEANGGVNAMERRASERSASVYDIVDRSGGFYTNPVDEGFRSHMNVVFRLSDEDLETEFLEQAEAQRLLNLKGHRSVGGIRASIYNGLPTESVTVLCDFMTDFAERHG